ncbi:xylose isomerase [Cephaloticoccus capnophilus]|uniref:Xylose isomerase n=2 Tax=Cephaloticoccus capnophilus TaxID=1548208 RepID=A0A139SU68_9BACT|nr:xylose isomerase [Cephaloticoccus capnophilus]
MAEMWGWDSFCQKVKEAGYDGIEGVPPATRESRELMFAAVHKYGLRFAVTCGCFEPGDYTQQSVGYKALLEDMVQLKPDFINCQTGRDHYSFEQNKVILDIADAISRDSGIPIYHETHRSRFNFAAHITKDYLEKIPELSLTLDISHWCNVHESMLEDQQDAVSLALSRTTHIHARVGHHEGPQVNDPAAPEWKDILGQHLRWWDEVVAQRIAQGQTQLSITPEFGPPSYMPTLPYTCQPLADQWQVNLFMFKLLKARYSQ